MRKLIVILIVILPVNLLTAFLILPYAQNTANSHMNSGPFFGVLFYIISAIIILLAVYILISHKDIKLFLLFLVFAFTVIFWGYRLCHLYCLGCATSG